MAFSLVAFELFETRRDLKRFSTLIRKLDKETRLKILQEEDNDDNTVLLGCLLFDMQLKDFLTAAEMSIIELLPLLQEVSKGGSLLHYSSGGVLIDILTELKPEDRVIALGTGNKSGVTVLGSHSYDPEFFERLLTFVLAPEDCFALITLPDEDGNTVLHYSSLNIETFKVISKKLTPEQMSAELQRKNKQNLTPLHKACGKPMVFKTMLENVFPKDRLSALSIKNETGYSVLNTLRSALFARMHEAYPEFFQSIIAMLPNGDEVFNALQNLNRMMVTIEEKESLNAIFLDVVEGKYDRLDPELPKGKSGSSYFSPAAEVTQDRIIPVLNALKNNLIALNTLACVYLAVNNIDIKPSVTKSLAPGVASNNS